MSTLVAESFMKSANNSSTGILPNTSIIISEGKPYLVVKIIAVKLPFLFSYKLCLEMFLLKDFIT